MSMKPKAQTVGGGQATGTANAFNQFLTQGLNSGSFGNPVGQALGQTSGFGGAINSLLGGQPNSNNYLDQLNSMVAGGHNPMASLPNQPGYLNTQFSPLQNNFKGSNAMGLFSNPGTPGFDSTGGADIQAFINQFTNGGKGTMAQREGSLGMMPQIGGVSAGNAPADFGYRPGSLIDPSQDPQMKALSDLNARTTQSDIANQRSRFSLTGNSLGSGASLAEAQMRAEANPRNILALGQLGRDIQNQDLTQQGINNNQRIGMGGLANQFALGAGNIALGSQGNLIGQRSGDQNFLLGGRGQDIGQNQFQANLGQGLMNSTLGAATSMRGNNQNYNLGLMGRMLDAQGLDINSMLQAGGMNNAATQTGNQNNFQDTNAWNQFNTNMFGQGSQNALANQGMNNNWQSGLMSLLGNLGQGQQQMGMQGQLGMLGQLFGSLNGANQLGTAQAQTVMNPSTFSQVMGGITGLAGAAAPFFGGGFGGLAGLAGRASTPSGLGMLPQLGAGGSFASPNGPNIFGGGFGMGGMPTVNPSLFGNTNFGIGSGGQLALPNFVNSGIR